MMFPYNPYGGELLEVPITTMEFLGKRIPCGGGGYFRLFPFALSNWFIKRINTKEERACVFYFHPWEIDIMQPRVKKIDLKTRFRHYNGLNKMESKLRKLTRKFSWDRMDRIFLN